MEKLLKILLTVSCCLVMTGCNKKELITEQEAKNLVLSHANLENEDVVFSSVSLDVDDGEYEFTFTYDNISYEYEVDGYSSKVLEYNLYEITPQVQTEEQIDSSVTSDEAISIALEHAGVSKSNADSLKSKIDEENNSLVYEIEFNYGILKYEYEIKISDGTIVSFNVGT